MRGPQSNILVVDDTPQNLRLLTRALSSGGYRVRAALGGKQALQMARLETPDLVLLDIDMPDMDGYEVCEAMARDAGLAAVPVLFISALNDTESKVRAFERGGRDFVTKPFQIDEVLARVETHLKIRRMEWSLSEYNTRLEQMVADQVQEISEAQVATIVALARLAESRDDTTGMHVERIGSLVQVLARSLRRTAGIQHQLTEARIQTIGQAATLHDIGKVGIPDAILLKPARLTPEEIAVMKRHPLIGAETLDKVLESYPRNELIRVGAEIARSHHERWDGRGYPDGLAGTDIPLTGRLVALVDVYDAIRSPRPYKPGMSHQEALEEIRQTSGTHFDPAIADAFAGAEAELEAAWSAMQRGGHAVA